MKIGHAWGVLALAFASQAAAADLVLKPLPEQREAALWGARVLERYRYKPEGQPQPAGEKPFDAYLQALDGNRMVFTTADVAALEASRAKLDQIKDGSEIDAPFAIFDMYKTRQTDLFAYAKSVLHGPIDFTGTERFERVRGQAARAGSEAELRDLWRRRVMDDYLTLRLAGCTEKNIVPTLERRYDRHLARIKALTSADVFQLYMNAYAKFLDPHGAYLAARTDSLNDAAPAHTAGLGLVVQQKGAFISLFKLANAGPAERSGQLKPGDRIVGIAQGAGQPMVEVIGWGVEETVASLNGAPGSTVVLDVLPADAAADGSRKRVSLVRDLRIAPQNIASFRVEAVPHPGGAYRVGVIVVPTFYEDVAGRKAGADFMSMSQDVARLLQELKKAKVDAVLLDMRNNGGGPLDDARRFAGLFLPGAPIVQQRSFDGKVKVESAGEGVPAWDGVLGVLINKGSASATEIFAAAMQDYGRGIVIGDTSFGRGTVQTALGLDRFAKDKRGGLGQLTMTVAQSFRVDGNTLQQRGVTPDVVVPGVSDVRGTAAYGNGFQGRPIKAVDYKRQGDFSALLPALSTRHQARTGQDPQYQAMVRASARAQALKNKDEVSLNETERRRSEEARVTVDVKQVQLDEALRIMADEVELLRGTAPN